MRRPITTFDGFRNAVSAYRLPVVLLAALELDLFTVVGHRIWTVPELAKKLRVSERGLAVLCRNLAMAGVLLKQGATYKNTRLGGTELNADHPAYRGGYLDLIKTHWHDWCRLPESIRSGLPIDHDVPDSPEWRRCFTWAMHLPIIGDFLLLQQLADSIFAGAVGAALWGEYRFRKLADAGQLPKAA